MPEHWKIVRIEERLGVNERLQNVRVKVVTYRVGNQGPFTLEFTDEEFSEEAVRQAIEENAAKVRALTGE